MGSTQSSEEVGEQLQQPNTKNIVKSSIIMQHQILRLSNAGLVSGPSDAEGLPVLVPKKVQDSTFSLVENQTPFYNYATDSQIPPCNEDKMTERRERISVQRASLSGNDRTTDLLEAPISTDDIMKSEVVKVENLTRKNT